MIVEYILENLPPWIEIEGCSFELQFFCNGSNEMRLCYRLTGVSQDSKHYAIWKESEKWDNHFLGSKKDPYTCGWLYLREGIENDAQVIEACHDAWLFLYKNKLLDYQRKK